MGQPIRGPRRPHCQVHNRLRAAALLMMLGCVLAQADVVSLTSSQDNTLYQDAAGAVSNGAGVAMFAGLNSQSATRRALLRFDVASAVPTGATIDRAWLTLSNDAANTTPQSIGLHALLQAWGEGTSNAQAQGGGSGAAATVGDATWLHTHFDSSFWSSVGGDFNSSASASTTVAGPGLYTWNSTAALVGDVQRFLDMPTTNFGWLLRGNEFAASSAKRFATREVSNAALRPLLTIEFTPIPEPASAAALPPLALLLIPALRRAARCAVCWQAAARRRNG